MSDFVHELRVEQLLFWRSRELAFFTFLLPIVFFVLLGYGVAATAFAGLAITLVIRRESGVLKRLRATPLPVPAYIAGVLGSTIVVYAFESAALIVLGRVLFGVPFPSRIVSLVLALLLGAVAFAAMGIGLTTFVRSAEGSSAVVNAIYLPMAFIAGAFFSPHSFPAFLRAIADVLPLTYYIELVRNILLHGQQIWTQGQAVAVVAAWGLAGALVAARRFRWEPRDA